jgi:cobalt-precorrin 5A hydrolase / precorrin-3B C17-methyltransferase
MRPVVVSFAATGRDTADRIARAIGGEMLLDVADVLPRLFREGRAIIGVCAAGILIRKLAPILADKHDEPPVIAVSQDGAHIVPLLGGHRGANHLAREIAEALGRSAALTTASESLFARALDDPPEGWSLSNPEAAKPAMAALLRGEAIALDGEAPWLRDADYPIAADGTVRVTVTEYASGEGLIYHPGVLVAGVGCERGTSSDDVIALIDATLAEAHLSPLALAAIASIDINRSRSEQGRYTARAQAQIATRHLRHRRRACPD